MNDEAEKALEILQSAIQMEIDGRVFYLEAAQNSKSSLPRNLFEVLAKEEIAHEKAIKVIYDALKEGNEWPNEEITPAHGGNAENVFSAALKDPQQEKAAANDVEAVRIALEMEERSYKFYKDHSEQASDAVEIKFYQALAHEEQEHIASLRDTEEYLTDTEGWYMKKQHITLDGA